MLQCLPCRKGYRGKENNLGFFMIIVCVCQLVHGINCHSLLMSLSVEDSQTIGIPEICQGRILW